jgi:16S rRNA (cytosine1402-N4)-methyltransferase
VSEESVHTPVLLEEVLTLLAPREAVALLIDATLGEGGHAAAFLSRYPGLDLFGLDADDEILQRARRRLGALGAGERVRYFREWFDDFFVSYEARFDRGPDRILMDLGISMYHYRESGRGFSFRSAEPLDMRMNGSGGRTAADIVNRTPELELRRIIAEYGEERMAGRISRTIVQERKKTPLTQARQLADLIWRTVPPAYRHGPIHPATRTFQALRIAVNEELDRLGRGLAAAFEVLNPGGRLAVISFHSLEDRIVKQFFREKNKSCTCPPESPICQCGGVREARIITRKPVSASAVETESNPASRSAKLRVAEKLER